MCDMVIVGRRGHKQGKFTGLIKFYERSEAEVYIETKTKSNIKLHIKEN